MLAKPLVLLDLETTGLDPLTDGIVQLSAAFLSRKDLSVEKVFSSYVRPAVRITREAHAVHGLAERDLVDAPALQSVIEQFAGFAPEEAILAGHNVSFDVAFLKAAYAEVERPYRFDYHVLDVWSIAYFVLGANEIRAESYSLNSLCGLFGVKRDLEHDAEQDVMATAAILRHLLEAARGKSMGILGQYNLFQEQR